MKYNSAKWRLMVTTLPITGIVLAAKLIILLGIGYDGLVKFSDVGVVVTGGMFLIGFMLAGTMSDYKESEKVPSELASILETLEETLRLGHGAHGGTDLAAQRRQLLGLTDCLIGWFRRGCSFEDVTHAINGLTDITLVLEANNAGPMANRIAGEQHNLRKLFNRVNVIRQTHFLSTGYALMQVLTFVVIGLLLVAKFDSLILAIIITSFIAQIFVYMIRLIADIDEPFEYDPTGRAGAADVDLFPVLDYRERLAARTAASS